MNQWNGLVWIGDDYTKLVNTLSKRGVSITGRSVAQAIWQAGPGNLRLSSFIPGIGADLFVGGLWQLGNDLYAHPDLLYRNPGLLLGRAAVAAGSNAIIGVGEGLVLL